MIIAVVIRGDKEIAVCIEGMIKVKTKLYGMIVGGEDRKNSIYKMGRTIKRTRKIKYKKMTAGHEKYGDSNDREKDKNESRR